MNGTWSWESPHLQIELALPAPVPFNWLLVERHLNGFWRNVLHLWITMYKYWQVSWYLFVMLGRQHFIPSCTQILFNKFDCITIFNYNRDSVECFWSKWFKTWSSYSAYLSQCEECMQRIKCYYLPLTTSGTWREVSSTNCTEQFKVILG